MSRSGDRVGQLAAIRDLRALAERAAEARATALLRTAREQEARCREEDDLLVAALDDWHAILAASRFDPASAALFGLAVDRQNGISASAQDELDRVSAQLDAARGERGRAEAGSRCAAELLARASSRHRRWREERTLAERDDRNAGLAPRA